MLGSSRGLGVISILLKGRFVRVGLWCWWWVLLLLGGWVLIAPSWHTCHIAVVAAFFCLKSGLNPTTTTIKAGGKFNIWIGWTLHEHVICSACSHTVQNYKLQSTDYGLCWSTFKSKSLLLLKLQSSLCHPSINVCRFDINVYLYLKPVELEF